MLILPVAQKSQPRDAQLNTVLGDYRRKINEIIGTSLKEIFVQASEPRDVEAGTLWLDLSGEGSELKFLDLVDTPSAYSGEGEKLLAVKVTEDGLEFIVPPTGVDEFEELIDTPANYTGAANKFVKVNATPDGLEFVEEGTIDHDILTNTHDNPYKLDDLAVPDDNVDLDVSITKHGLTPKAPNDITKFLRGDASWGVPAGGNGGGDKISEGDSSVEVVDLGTGYIETKADNQQVRKDQVLGNIQPLQPVFLAYNSATDSNVTGDGTPFTVEFNIELFDQGGNFATPTFTAPVTGKYRFIFNIKLGGFNSSHTQFDVILVTSNRNYYARWADPYAILLSQAGIFNHSILADMDANDTVTVVVTAYGSTKTVSIGGHATNPHTHFSGALIC